MSIEEKTLGFIKLQNIIVKEEPFFIGRLGGCELAAMEIILFKKNFQNPDNFKNLIMLCNNAGIFVKNEKSLQKYTNEYIKSIKNSTLLGIWSGETKNQANEFYSKLYLWIKKENCIPAHCIEPYYFFKPSNHNLGVDYKFNELIKGKRVLVVSSHFNTLKKQQSKLDYTFKPYKIFENNTFIFIKPPVTHAGNHGNKDWYENFKKLKSDILDVKDGFDIALLSCGGYGMIASDYIYTELNKSCIYVGGALQLFFGIMGNRWTNNPDIDKFNWKDNENWCRPLKSDIPKNYKYIEGGCYW